jgi:hypothetical protein
MKGNHMAYYLDDCSGALIEYGPDELKEAVEIAKHAVQSARDFEAAAGFRPFWADAVEIRRGKPRLGSRWNGNHEERNAEIVKNTKVYRRFKA